MWDYLWVSIIHSTLSSSMVQSWLELQRERSSPWIYCSYFILIKYLLHTQHGWGHSGGTGWAWHPWRAEIDYLICRDFKALSSTASCHWLWGRLGCWRHNLAEGIKGRGRGSGSGVEWSWSCIWVQVPQSQQSVFQRCSAICTHSGRKEGCLLMWWTDERTQ